MYVSLKIMYAVFFCSFLVVFAAHVKNVRGEMLKTNEANRESPRSLLDEKPAADIHHFNELASEITDAQLVEIVRRKILPVHPAVASLPFIAGEVSETIDKKKIILCVRDANGRPYPINTLVHVAIHELAHVVQRAFDPDHSASFVAHFEPILARAIGMGIYDPREGVSQTYVAMCTRKK